MKLNSLRPENLPKFDRCRKLDDALRERVGFQILPEEDLAITRENQRDLVAGVALIRSRVTLGLFQRRPQIAPRLFGFKNRGDLSFVQENAVSLLAVQVLPPPLPGDREVCDVPPAFSQMRLGQEFRSEEHTSELQSLRHLVCRL